MLTLACVALAVHQATLAKSSYSAYSAKQLDFMRAELERVDRGEGEDFQLALLGGETRRRVLLPVSAGLSVGLGAATVLAWRRRRSGKMTDEELRLLTAVSPPPSGQGEFQRAAALLGVAANAPAHVIDAALAAQIRAQPPEAHPKLLRARDVLLKKHPPPAPSVSSQ